MMPIENGKKVSFHYTLTVEEEVLQSSEGAEPLSYTHGSGQIIPGLAAGMEGMNEGEKKTILVSSENAYGPVNPEAFNEVPKSALPGDLEIEEGMMLQARSPEGQSMPVRVAEIREDTVLMDMNHPLAGKDLKFDVKIVSVE
ncbi:MAG: peptidylprolyl isomerase [Acidobacteria bacterium]|nr:peptidylprolyl isomerase [Acidobacteriota bacterium]